MVSPVTAPRRRVVAPYWVRTLLASAAAAPLLVASLMLAQSGYLSDTHGAFLSRVLFALDRGQLELLGFEYPPLPFLMLLPWPTVTLAIIFGALAIFSLAWLVLNDCTMRRSILPFVLLLGALWSPIGLHLVASDFNEAVGLFALYGGWRHYRRWWETRKTIHGLYTGLWLGVAFYTSPLGLGLALIAGAVLPLLFPRLQIPPFASQLVLLVFPGIAATATWAYLSWVFTQRVAFPFAAWEPHSPGFVQIVSWTVPYLLVAFFSLLRPKATTAGVLLPFVLLLGANRVGWHFSLAFAVVLLTLVAIIAIPPDLDRSQRALLGGAAVAQALVAWVLVPWPHTTTEDIVSRTVATALAPAPARSILLDDRYATRLLKWAPSLAPYLTTRDTGFEVALAEPRAVVDYVVVTPDGDGLSLDADVRPPAGFQVDWNWGGYILYRRPGAPRLPVRFDRLLVDQPVQP
ncbi:MAG: hypothetical protein ABJC19_03335 [Gemmatimonadota bacterium]